MDTRYRQLVRQRLSESLPGEDTTFLEESIFENLEKAAVDDEKAGQDFRRVFLRINGLIDAFIGSFLFSRMVGEDEKDLTTRALRLYTILSEEFSSTLDSAYVRPYDPVILCLKGSCRHLEEINRPLSQVNPTLSLISDIFATVFRKVDGFCQMLTLGLYPDAFVAWRTLHESECIVSLLVQGGEAVRQAYVRHIAYNNAYRNQEHFTKEELDQTFLEIKDEMKDHGLKSKDMKKFIEYGWLYAHPEYDSSNVAFKLNFRDGVERLSGLSRYSKVYEGASEIAHSSSAFFYVNDAFCRDLSEAMVYQTYARIVSLFLEYMKVYFALHPSQKETALLLLEDVKKLSLVLETRVGTIKEIEDAEKTD